MFISERVVDTKWQSNTRHRKAGAHQIKSARPYTAQRIIGTLFISFFLGSTNAQETQPKALSFEQCSIIVQAMEVDAECATLKRHENPNDTLSKMIDLSVIRLPSHSTEPESDAFTVIQGGPGGSSINFAIAYRQAFEKIRRKRDVIVIDQRGTGRSNLLTCNTPKDSSTLFDVELTKRLTKECANTLSEHSDLRYYTTSIAVNDLEALRIAAGYSQLNLYGVSYGTRVVQHYVRKYPNSARSAVIDGVVQIGLNLAGGEVARRWEDSFEALNNRCKHNEVCLKTYGNLRSSYEKLQAKFSEEALTISIPHPSTGQPTDYTFNEYSLFSAMRLMAYNTEGSALMPLMLSEALKGNYGFVASQIIQMEASFQDQFAIGMHNSIMCTEDAPFVTKEDQARANGTIVSELMSNMLQASCSVWPKGIMDDGFREPFSSTVPVLVLSGETDPITPPKNGKEAAKMLGNTKHIIVPAHGHGVLARGCVPNLVGIFIDEAGFEGVDISCTQRERTMPIFTSLTGPKP